MTPTSPRQIPAVFGQELQQIANFQHRKDAAVRVNRQGGATIASTGQSTRDAWWARNQNIGPRYLDTADYPASGMGVDPHPTVSWSRQHRPSNPAWRHVSLPPRTHPAVRGRRSGERTR